MAEMKEKDEALKLMQKRLKEMEDEVGSVESEVKRYKKMIGFLPQEYEYVAVLLHLVAARLSLLLRRKFRALADRQRAALVTMKESLKTSGVSTRAQAVVVSDLAGIFTLLSF